MLQACYNVRRQRCQPSMQGLKTLSQQHSQIKAALESFDGAYPAAQAELLADWPTALDTSSHEQELPRLHGMPDTSSTLICWHSPLFANAYLGADDVQLLCQQHQTAGTHVRQSLQDEASKLQASFEQRVNECQDTTRSHHESSYARQAPKVLI